MLWLAVHLPMFALEVNQAGRHTRAPAVLVDGNRVLLGNRAALQAGIGLQGTLATAHGICPGLIHYRRDPGRELKRLRLLAGMCYRFTSRVSLEPPGDGQTASALLLEVSGSLKLFGPMDAWQSGVEALCRDLGHAAVLRAAAAPSAALALARAGVSHLPDVPLFHTELAGAEVESLANMGIRTLGPLLQLPQAEIGQRFGAGLTNYLQRLAGAAPDPRRCIEPEPVFASGLNLLDPITDKSALLFPMQRLLTELEHWLIGRQLGAGRLLWRFAPHEAAAGVSMPVRFAAARQRKSAFMEVVRLALNKAELPENVLQIGLKAKSLAPWTTRSRELFELPLQQEIVTGHPSQEAKTAPTELIDRFAAHLGETRCSGIAVTGQHVPEWAWRRHKTGETGDSPDSRGGINRPLWFFDPPRRIDRQAFEILSGPERLQTGWWSSVEGSRPRDYYVIRCGNGARGWAFVQPDGDWFLHGYFG
ncbi:MAG: DNA polymerase Y family protein [Gammaproteobacteria bacterium]|nr:DNA polymerase Y family protein [Gammaproteobacteria bacterium]